MVTFERSASARPGPCVMWVPDVHVVGLSEPPGLREVGHSHSGPEDVLAPAVCAAESGPPGITGAVERSTSAFWDARLVEQRLPGGNAGGAVLVDGTVRRAAGPWTPAVHELLGYLASRGFDGAPRPYGYDDQGREILSFVAGETVGDAAPWPEWVHSDLALQEAGSWLRRYHDTVRDFRPSANATWRLGGRPWQPGDVIAHNDAAPYNVVWDPRGEGPGRIVGFVDWDFAAPQTPIWDLAYLVFSWVPLHARHVVTREGFTDFDGRARRLHLLLDAYGWTGTIPEVLEAVSARVAAHMRDVQRLAATDPLFAKLVSAGTIEDLARALRELHADPVLGG